MFVELTALVAGVNAAGWNRRVYYDALGCKGNMVHGIMVYQSANCIASNPVVNSACEDKSTSNPQSSEGTSCETVSNADDSVYFPPENQAGRASAYVSINRYTGTTCSGLNEGFQQNIIAADGKCYADERGSYFKATCNGQNALIHTYCKDSSCTECALESFDGTCQTSLNGLAVKSICIGGSMNGNQSQTSNPGSSATNGQTQTSSAGAAQKNSVASPDGTIFGLILAVLSALII